MCLFYIEREQKGKPRVVSSLERIVSSFKISLPVQSNIKEIDDSDVWKKTECGKLAINEVYYLGCLRSLYWKSDSF